MNIAKRLKEYYKSEDFKCEYGNVLYERFCNNEHEIVKRIQEKFNVSNYETNGYFEWNHLITYEEAKKVYDFISENFERFVCTYSGYYVGYTSLESVWLGEQEEQLTGLYNSRTKRDYTIKYLRKVFNAEDYYVSGEYAYYILDGGLHVELLNCKDEINLLLKN